MTSPSKRRDMDVMRLMMSNFEVKMGKGDSVGDFFVKFPGPTESPYTSGWWNIHVVLPPEYPYKSPSIGFCNTIYHPNVDEGSGSVCLDVINQAWSPMFDLLAVFQQFLPQLLLYPNASDPLNGEAAALYMKDKKLFDIKAAEYVQKFATEDSLPRLEDIANGRRRRSRASPSRSRSESQGSSTKTNSTAPDFSEPDDEEEDMSDLDDEDDFDMEL